MRARLALLSEIPVRVGARRFALARPHCRAHRGELARSEHRVALLPDLVGAWPLPVERAIAYMEKATRRRRLHTSWLTRTTLTTQAVAGVRRRGAGRRDVHRGRRSLRGAAGRAGADQFAGPDVAQADSPGVPDIYQGTRAVGPELWSIPTIAGRSTTTLRRRVAGASCRTRAMPIRMVARGDEGVRQALVIGRALALRRRDPSAFGPERLRAAAAAGEPAAQHVVAFARGGRGGDRRPASRAADSRAEDGATRASACRRAAGATCSPASRSQGGARPWLELARARFPWRSAGGE